MPRSYRDASVRQGDIEARYLPLLLLGVITAAGLLHALLLLRQGGLITAGDVVGLFRFAAVVWLSHLCLHLCLFPGLAGDGRGAPHPRPDQQGDRPGSEHDRTTNGEMQGDVVFENVSFCLRARMKRRPISQISFSVKAGQTVAIVGQTGTGKTSLVKLINRTYDVNDGRVLVDGVDVRDWQLAALRRQVSIIEQDIFLFSRSIRTTSPLAAQEATR